MFTSHRGRLLVATPELADPNFERAVVFLLEHTPEGAVGVVVNRPSGASLSEAGADWNGWDAFAAPPEVVFVGGPVSRTAVIAVARSVEGKTDGFQPVLGDDVGVVDLGVEPRDVEAVRLFAGYAGWAGGQLEGELTAGGWFILDALPSDPLSPDPDELWRAVLRRQGGRLALFAACPPDPTLN
ncbi:MAG: YqgE/AlgH family protein [Acidimicrobiia bacterium]